MSKIIFDKKKCIDCGMCINFCPKYFDLINDKVKLIKESIDNKDLKQIKQVIEACPNNAISYLEEKNV